MDFNKLHDTGTSKTSQKGNKWEKVSNNKDIKPTNISIPKKSSSLREMENSRLHPKKKINLKRTGVQFNFESYQVLKSLELAISQNRSQEHYRGQLADINVVKISTLVNSLTDLFEAALEDHLGTNWADEIPDDIISEEDLKEWMMGFFNLKRAKN